MINIIIIITSLRASAAPVGSPSLPGEITLIMAMVVQVLYCNNVRVLNMVFVFIKTSIMFTSEISDSSIKKVVLTFLIRAMYLFFHIQF